VIDKNRHIIKNIPYLGSPIIAMEKTLGEASEKVFKVIGDDYEAMNRRCNNLGKVTSKLGKYQGFVDDSTDHADLARTNLQDLKTWTKNNDCCLDQQLDNIVEAVNTDLVILATQVYKICDGDVSIPSFDFSLPDLALMDDIERVANEVSAWIEKTIGEFMDGADYHQCCNPTLSFFVDLVSDISGLAMCPVTGATNGVVSESFDVLLPLVQDDIVDVVNQEGEKLNSSSNSINSLLSALDQYGIPMFAATSAWDTICSLDVELPQSLIGFQQISPPSMVQFQPLEPPEADGSFDLAAIGDAIKQECTDAAKAFTENIDCCPAATIKVHGAYPFAYNSQECTYDTDCHTDNCVLVGSPYGSRCTDGRSGSYCGNDADCDGECVAYGIGNGSFCSDGKEGDYCGGITAKDCSSGHYCYGPHDKCYDGSNGDSCGTHSNCDSGICNVSLGSKCSSGSEGTKCSYQSDCASGNYCFRGTCYNGSNGDPCGVHGDCDSRICSIGLGSKCSSGGEGSTCSLHGDCASGNYCFKNNLTDSTGKCYNGSYNDPCRTDGQCDGNRCSGILGAKGYCK
jgi:hypothetical protein